MARFSLNDCFTVSEENNSPYQRWEPSSVLPGYPADLRSTLPGNGEARSLANQDWRQSQNLWGPEKLVILVILRQKNRHSPYRSRLPAILEKAILKRYIGDIVTFLNSYIYIL